MHAPQLRVQVSGPPFDLGRARLCPRGTLSGLLDVSTRRMDFRLSLGALELRAARLGGVEFLIPLIRQIRRFLAIGFHRRPPHAHSDKFSGAAEQVRRIWRPYDWFRSLEACAPTQLTRPVFLL
jgi:hypothetical protein